MDAQFWMITIPTLVIFFTLAALLLGPIWRFLDREEKVSERWTPETVGDRLQEHEERLKAYEAQKAPSSSRNDSDE